jgi:hypothetical protein
MVCRKYSLGSVVRNKRFYSFPYSKFTGRHFVYYLRLIKKGHSRDPDQFGNRVVKFLPPYAALEYLLKVSQFQIFEIVFVTGNNF